MGDTRTRRRACLAAAIAVLAALPASVHAAPGDWTQERADAALTASNPAETVITADTASSLGLDWRADDGGDLESVSVTGQGIFTSWEGGVIERRDLDGRLRWVTSAGGSCAGNGVISGRVLIVPCLNRIIAVSTKDGHGVWTYGRPEGTALSLTLSKGVVYVPWQAPGAIEALDAATGAQLWRLPLASAPATPVAIGRHRIVYCDDDTLQGLDLQTHAVRFTSAGGCGGMALSKDAIFLRQGDSLRLSDGTPRFRIPVFGDFEPAVGGDTVYYISTCCLDEEGVVAASATTGAVLFRGLLPGFGEEARSATTIAGGVIWAVGEDGYLHGFSAATGDQLVAVSAQPHDGFFDFSQAPLVSHGRVVTRGSGLRVFTLGGRS
jgi:outer membrane protein assembly factor BamB